MAFELGMVLLSIDEAGTHANWTRHIFLGTPPSLDTLAALTLPMPFIDFDPAVPVPVPVEVVVFPPVPDPFRGGDPSLVPGY